MQKEKHLMDKYDEVFSDFIWMNWGQIKEISKAHERWDKLQRDMSFKNYH